MNHETKMLETHLHKSLFNIFKSHSLSPPMTSYIGVAIAVIAKKKVITSIEFIQFQLSHFFHRAQPLNHGLHTLHPFPSQFNPFL